MQKNLKVVFSLFLIFITTSKSFSQEISISTEFLEDGYLFENINDFSNPLTQFKENEKCLVTAYLGKYIYKVKYKQWEGYVKDQFLLINEAMMDLYYDYEEEQKLKAIQEKEDRLIKRSQITRSEQINNQKKTDSIANTKEKKQKNIEALRIANQKYIQQEKQRKIDSTTKAREEQQKQIEAIRIANEKYIQQSKQRKLDSITESKEEKEKQIEALRIANQKYIQQEKQRKLDSTTKAKEEKQKQIEAIRISNEKQVFLKKQKKQDSIAKIEEDTNLLEKLKLRNTCHYFINEYDEYYKKQIIITDKYTISKNINIELIREGNTSKIHINLSKNLGCANYVPSRRSSVNITLENNEIVKLYHSGSLDCNDFSLKGILSPSKINLLKNYTIKSITLKGTKESVTITNINYKEFFIDKLKCIE